MRFRSFLSALVLILVTGLSQVYATNLFWSGNGTTQGGAGTWNQSAAHFDVTAGGPYTTVWANANVDSAEFGLAGGQVNIGGPIVVNTITTDLAGVNIGNGNSAGAANTITFSGANAGVNTNYAGGTTTISAVINGTVVKSGAGRMELGNGNNPANGATAVKYVLNGGALTSASAARLSSAAPSALVSDFMTFNGGGWAINTGNQDTGANRGITVRSGGANFNTSVTGTGAASLMTISSPIVGTEGGGITITNVGPFVGNAHQGALTLLLTNTANSWNGNATISTGTLRLGVGGVIPDTAVVNLTTSGVQFDVGTNSASETIKSISGTAGTIALGAAGILTVNDPAGETYSSVFTGTAGSKFVKNGTGALTLSGGSTGFSGEMVLNDGTLGIGGANSLGSNALGPQFTINGGKLSNNSASGRSMSANLSVNLNGDFTVDDSLAATQGQILFNGGSTIKNSDRTITVNGTANLGFAGVVGQDVAGRSLTKSGTGILALTNTANTYSGSTTLSQGQINVDADGSFGDGTGDLNLNGGTLNASASRTVTTPNPLHLNASAAITTTSAATTAQFNFGSNTVTGVGGAVLTLRNDGADASTDQLQVRFFGSGYDFSNNIDMPAGANGSSTELSSFNTTGTTQTYSGVISGTGSFKRSASVGPTGGTTVFNQQNTFSGGVLLNDGTIELAANSTGPANAPTSGPVGTGTITVGNINSPKLAASGAARNVGNPIAFSANNNIMGISDPSSGSNDLTLTGDVSLGATAGVVTRTLNVTSTANSILSGVISNGGANAGSLTKAGPGSLSLTGANTYTGDTSVTGGTLSISNAYLDDLADVYLNTGSFLKLDFTGTDIIDSLFIDSAMTIGGTWGAIGNGLATNHSALITGSGVLQITTGAVVSLPGDFNSDNKVDAADYVTWRINGEPNTAGAGALPNDGGAADQNARLTLWRANFGNPGAGGGLGSSAAIPEPASIAIVLIGLALLGLGRRRIG